MIYAFLTLCFGSVITFTAVSIESNQKLFSVYFSHFLRSIETIKITSRVSRHGGHGRNKDSWDNIGANGTKNLEKLRENSGKTLL